MFSLGERLTVIAKDCWSRSNACWWTLGGEKLCK